MPPAAQPLMSWPGRRGKPGAKPPMLDQAGLVLPGERAAGTAGQSSRAVRLWLFAVAALILVMVIVGGATRLTESGSVDHRMEAGDRRAAAAQRSRLAGRLRRLQADSAIFGAARRHDAGGFKAIYAWEWGHRLLARLIGLAFILPALWFWRQRRAQGRAGAAGAGRRPRSWRSSRSSAGGWSAPAWSTASRWRSSGWRSIC